MMEASELIKLFGMQNLLLESELRKLEESGIQIEHTKTIQKSEIVDVELFESDILQEAQRMADFYVIYYALENSIRRLISERLSEKKVRLGGRMQFLRECGTRSLRSGKTRWTRSCRFDPRTLSRTRTSAS
jgi:hypothetical protein